MTSADEALQAETLGLIKGLAEVVHQQHQSLKDTAQHLQGLVTTVEQLTQTLNPKVSASTQELRLPNLVLPEYTSKTDLDRFLDQIQHLLETSGVHPKFWVTLIKQQCQKDSRAYDALSESEKVHQAILGPDLAKTSEDEYHTYFTECVKTLREKRGKPRDRYVNFSRLTTPFINSLSNQLLTFHIDFVRYSVNYRNSYQEFISLKVRMELEKT